MPNFLAQSAASVEQAPIDAITEMLDIAAFATISHPHLPLNKRTISSMVSSSIDFQTTLSTALCLPMSSERYFNSPW